MKKLELPCVMNVNCGVVKNFGGQWGIEMFRQKDATYIWTSVAVDFMRRIENVYRFLWNQVHTLWVFLFHILPNVMTLGVTGEQNVLHEVPQK